MFNTTGDYGHRDDRVRMYVHVTFFFGGGGEPKRQVHLLPPTLQHFRLTVDALTPVYIYMHCV